MTNEKLPPTPIKIIAPCKRLRPILQTNGPTSPSSGGQLVQFLLSRTSLDFAFAEADFVQFGGFRIKFEPCISYMGIRGAHRYCSSTVKDIEIKAVNVNMDDGLPLHWHPTFFSADVRFGRGPSRVGGSNGWAYPVWAVAGTVLGPCVFSDSIQ